MPDVTEPTAAQSLEAICARVVGGPWEAARPSEKAHMREYILEVLNAAVAEGWIHKSSITEAITNEIRDDNGSDEDAARRLALKDLCAALDVPFRDPS